MILSFEDWLSENYPEMGAEAREELLAAIATIPEPIWEYIRDLAKECIRDLIDSERRRYVQ
jgi:hypothetical protein